MPEAKQARLSLRVAEATRHIPRVHPTPAPITLLLRTWTTESPAPVQAPMPPAFVGHFSIWRRAPSFLRLWRARSLCQPLMSVNAVLLTDCLRALRTLVAPLRATLHTCPMAHSTWTVWATVLSLGMMPWRLRGVYSQRRWRGRGAFGPSAVGLRGFPLALLLHPCL